MSTSPSGLPGAARAVQAPGLVTEESDPSDFSPAWIPSSGLAPWAVRTPGPALLSGAPGAGAGVGSAWVLSLSSGMPGPCPGGAPGTPPGRP